MTMASAIEERASDNSGVVMATLLVLQLFIVPVLGWVGVTLWAIRADLADATQNTAVLQSEARHEHQQFDSRLEDHEDRIRSLERRASGFNSRNFPAPLRFSGLASSAVFYGRAGRRFRFE